MSATGRKRTFGEAVGGMAGELWEEDIPRLFVYAQTELSPCPLRHLRALPFEIRLQGNPSDDVRNWPIADV